MKKAMLMILDGWGIGKDYPGNAIELADTPVMDLLIKEYPHTSLDASGLAVGLPEGQMGNSEVGHLNIGAGRVIYQDLTMINKEIAEGGFFENECLLKAIRSAKNLNKGLHLFGLISEGGVHSHLNHVYAILQMCKNEGLDRVYIHVFLDGRDVPPTIGSHDVASLIESCERIGVGEIATVGGRYYGMDRDKRWDRVELAYDAILLGEGKRAEDPVAAINASYEQSVTDEFMIPTVIEKNGKPVATLADGDSVIFFNFRPDRARQLTHAIMDEDFEGFERKKVVSCYYVTMTEYDKTIQNVDIAYPPESYENTLGQVIAANGLRQLRIAETEKYAHVTFFFNGGVEVPNDNEERILIPSPKVATYDLQPEMSAEAVKDAVVEKINANEFDLIVLNFANCDMVGHTGNIPAEIKAVQTVDACVGAIVDTCIINDVSLLITADHGNGEQMIDEVNGGPFTAHTTNKVPLIYVSGDNSEALLDGGKLSDLAPTLLDLMGVAQPKEMTGHTLIKH